MRAGTVEDEVRSGFPFLFQIPGFTLSSDAEMPGFVAVGCIGALKLRFVRDRDDFLCDVKLPGFVPEWRDVYEVLGALGAGDKGAARPKRLHTVPALARLIRDNIPALLQRS